MNSTFPCQLIGTSFANAFLVETCALLEVVSDVDWYSAVAQESLKLEPHHYFLFFPLSSEDCKLLYSYLIGDLSFEYLKPIWKEVDVYLMVVDKKLELSSLRRRHLQSHYLVVKGVVSYGALHAYCEPLLLVLNPEPSRSI